MNDEPRSPYTNADSTDMPVQLQALDSEAEAQSSPSLDEVVREFEGPLRRYVTGILRDPHAAGDVVQDTFLKYHRHWVGGDRVCREVSGWLHRVAHNRAVDHIRRESRLRGLHERSVEEASPQDDARRARDRKERMALVLRLVEELADGERDVMVLRLQEGLSYREISERTGRSEGNVGCLLHHAVKKLSERLKQLDAI